MAELSTYHLEVYGCQMNVHDSEIIAGILEGAGMVPAPSAEAADLILIVTCAVRESAETRAMGRASQLCGLKNDHGATIVGVCGCIAQEHGSALLERIPGLDFVVGPDMYHRLPEILQDPMGVAATGFSSTGYDDVKAVRRDFPRAFVTVMRGCNNYCTYCIVPYVRGRERSRPVDAVLDEVGGLAAEGYGEITLLGQNVNSYRDGDVGFPRLLTMVADRAAPAWIRFVTSHPRDFGPDLARAMASRSNVCPMLHLPAQSGSNEVLASMGRGYTVEEYLEKIRFARAEVPKLVLSTDIIAGFPGETRRDFMETEALLRKVRFDYAFLFRYSERKGTKAAELRPAVPVELRLERLQRLQAIQRKITLERSSALVGNRMEVLITGSARREGQQAARSPGNRMVVLEGTDFPKGSRVMVEIYRADGWTHFGRVV